MTARRGLLTREWRDAAWVALVAVFLQALVFTLATPVKAAPVAADFPFGLHAFCGTAPTDGQHKAQHQPDCQTCPLCQGLISAGLYLSPRGPLLPMRSRTLLYRLAPVTAQAAEARVAEAAQPRGPPSDLDSQGI